MLQFVHTCTFYPAHLDQIYARHQGLSERSYEIQLQTILSDNFGWVTAWKQHLEATRQYEVRIIVTNCKPLQLTWAKENNLLCSSVGWSNQVLRAQLSAVRPNLWFSNTYTVSPALHIELKKLIPSLKILGWDGLSLCDTRRYVGCDLVLTCSVEALHFYLAHGTPCVLFPFGFEPDVLRQLPALERTIPCSFVGQLSFQQGGHFCRFDFLRSLVDLVDINLYLSTLPTAGAVLLQSLRAAQSLRFQNALDLWHRYLASAILSKRNLGIVFGLDMYRVLGSSVLTLNSHIDAAGNRAGNMRLWEATGMGACLITDYKENLHEIFIPDEEVVVYRTAEECAEKIRYLGRHPDRAAEIGARGQQRTLSQYTMKRRIESILPHLRRLSTE